MADYGSKAGIGALVPQFSGTNQDFADTTRPTDTQVDLLLTQISGMVNSILAQAGFETPITTPTDVNAAIDAFVDQEIADIVAGMNSAGRFGPSSKQIQKTGRLRMVLEDIQAFVEGSAVGFERLGATRTYQQADSIGYRGEDESGDEISPLFQREAFGNVPKDWDT